MQNARWIVVRDPEVKQKLADLNRAGVRPQNHAIAVRPFLQIESVHILSRRVMRRNIEFREAVVVSVDVGPFSYRKAHVGKDLIDLVKHLAQRMNTTIC